jgi:hypothetical protein
MTERERLLHSFLMLSRSPAESNSTYVVDCLDAYLEKYIEVMALRGKVEQLKPLRQWVGLTDEDKAEILSRKWWNFEDEFDLTGFLGLVETKLKEKNGG